MGAKSENHHLRGSSFKWLGEGAFKCDYTQFPTTLYHPTNVKGQEIFPLIHSEFSTLGISFSHSSQNITSAIPWKGKLRAGCVSLSRCAQVENIVSMGPIICSCNKLILNWNHIVYEAHFAKVKSSTLEKLSACVPHNPILYHRAIPSKVKVFVYYVLHFIVILFILIFYRSAIEKVLIENPLTTPFSGSGQRKIPFHFPSTENFHSLLFAGGSRYYDGMGWEPFRGDFNQTKNFQSIDPTLGFWSKIA